MSTIVNPISSDRRVGYDSRGQLWCEVDRGGGYLTETIIADTRSYKCQICETGWETSCESMRDQFYDRSIEAWVHRSCYVRTVGYLERQVVIRAVEKVRGDTKSTVKTSANKYGGAWNTPWYEFSFKGFEPFTLEVGMRKRVWAITAKLVTVAQSVALETAFSEENVTKGRSGILSNVADSGYMIHAWGDAKLEEYISKIVEIVTVKFPIKSLAAALPGEEE